LQANVHTLTHEGEGEEASASHDDHVHSELGFSLVLGLEVAIGHHPPHSY
jgi:hypothetical protein